MSSECHKRDATDYDGYAVKWGSANVQETWEACCESCKNYKPEAPRILPVQHLGLLPGEGWVFRARGWRLHPRAVLAEVPGGPHEPARQHARRLLGGVQEDASVGAKVGAVGGGLNRGGGTDSWQRHLVQQKPLETDERRGKERFGSFNHEQTSRRVR